MRLLRLDLIAFGPFSGAGFDFAAPVSRPGVHVVFGANEAGKSSTLRALRAALFEFPVQTSDDFRHPYAKLRVGATLENGDGQTLSFVRRKGAKNTLLAADGQTPLPTDALRPYLGNIKEEEFFSMFAIGHAELRAGGQEVLKGQGRLSELLFMTAAGLPRLRRAERSLTEEAEALFKPRGEKPPINEALLRLKELRAVQKEKSLPAAEYLRHTEALKQAKAQRAAVEEELAGLRVRKARLDRLSQALPTAARLKQYRGELEALADAPRLPADFTAKREALERESRGLAGRLEQLRADLERTERQLAELCVPDELLAAGPEIERLFKRLGSHEKAEADTKDRLAEIAQLEADAKALLRSVRPDLDFAEVETLRLTRQEQATIRELAARGRELAAAIKKFDEETRRLRERIAQTAADLERLGREVSSEPLRRAVKAAAREGDLDAVLAAAEAEVAESGRMLDRGLAALPLWSGPVEELARLAVPPAATIERFEIAFAAVELEVKRLGERRAEAMRALREAERALEQAARGGEVPSEEALREARRRRDSGWREVRRDLEGRGPGPDRAAFLAGAAGEPLPDVYEAAVRGADDVADRLRGEAERVERIAGLGREREARRAELVSLGEAEVELGRRREALAAEWAGHWGFLAGAPLPPREMREWFVRHGDLVRVAEQHRAASAKAEEVRRRIESHRGAIVDALGATGGSPASVERRTTAGTGGRAASGTPPHPSNLSLRSLVEEAERVADERDAVGERRRTLVAERERAERDLKAAEAAAGADREEFAAVRAGWGERMGRLGLAESARSDAALAVLDTLAEVFKKLDAIGGLRERVEAMGIDAGVFAADVRGAAGRLAPELASRPFEEAAAALQARLVEARSARDRREELSERRERVAGEIAEAMQRSGVIAGELKSLCKQAGCGDPAGLPEAEARSAERRRVEALVEQAEEELRQRSGGRTVAEFLAEIEAADPEKIGLEVERAEKRLVEIQDRRVELEGVVTRHEQELSRMTGGAEAVTAAEEAEAVAARLAADVERYAKLRFAAKLLRDGRERYRQKTGNAVLDRAGELFATLTGGSFAGLAVDYGENDEPLLVGVRPDKQTVRAVGMSDGTADQLYLALRLAGLSAWLDAHDPLPFVVDDILVHFDDVRSAAALRALASLAERTQVILFTHHAHLVDLARETLPGDVLYVHTLGGAEAVGLSRGGLAVEESAAEPVEANGRSKRSLF